MDVILLEKVANLGDLGDKVAVKSGYGRNFLIPQKKAVRATKEKIAEFEVRRAELEAAAAEQLTVAQTRADAIGQLEIKITQQAGEEGKLFGSVGTADIAAAVIAAGAELKKQEVRLPEGVIRVAGDHQVDLELHTDVVVTITVTIIGEE
ncbi:MAG: 50S ribosomal protein L9 [Gammaproteobacteria bacterium]|nr:MAG: 50S ribosomal protein L9 [Gammaproteobacteria bacterium]RLA20120.1 MAG: 50S ribosomal protein L9 [Gammaproteobacteria bacterium]